VILRSPLGLTARQLSHPVPSGQWPQLTDPRGVESEQLPHPHGTWSPGLHGGIANVPTSQLYSPQTTYNEVYTDSTSIFGSRYIDFTGADTLPIHAETAPLPPSVHSDGPSPMVFSPRAAMPPKDTTSLNPLLPQYNSPRRYEDWKEHSPGDKVRTCVIVSDMPAEKNLCVETPDQHGRRVTRSHRFTVAVLILLVLSVAFWFCVRCKWPNKRIFRAYIFYMRRFS